ncbi:MAG: C39 family peptidase [Actinomycetota bacterium]|nr:C39 family peptidase [Actinomycetota bacterium]
MTCYPQLLDNWCWAACIQMVTTYRGNPVQQCQAANMFLNRNDCCPSNVVCNVTMNAVQSVNLYHQLGYANTQVWWYPFTFAQVQWAIDNNLPFEAGLYWPTHAHDVVVRGYNDDAGAQNVYVCDPWEGPMFVTYNYLLTGYGNGNWTETVYGM